MAEWLRRQIRISFAICFPMGAQVQILLVSLFFFFSSISLSSQKPLNDQGLFRILPFVFLILKDASVLFELV